MANNSFCAKQQMECATMSDKAGGAGEASLTQGMSDKVDALSSEVKQLEATFDVWQRMVEPILSSAEIAMQYDSNLITFLGIGGAVIIALMTFLFSRDRKKILEDAVKELDDRLAKGMFPEGSKARSRIIKTIIESDDFEVAVGNILDYPDKSKETDDNRGGAGGIDKTGEDKLTSENLGEDSDSSDKG